ncbi:MAG TPA: DinB family protein [Flavisolibacter sp.]|nr:DinB family protein [Flavisolibacter sp.]
MDFVTQLAGVQAQAAQYFSSLPAAKLNWKPQPDKWSIGQCLHHLIVSDSTYIDTFDRLLNGSYKLPLVQRLNPFKKALGPMMIKTLSPEPKKKFKAPALFRPAESSLPADIVPRFIDHEENMKGYFQKLSLLDTNGIVITSPVSAVISYSLADCMQIIVNHGQRHLNQAKNILDHPKFPS